MTKLFIPLVATVMTIAVIASAPTSAQNAEKDMGNSMPTFVDLDLNDDGQISETEFSKARGERIAKRVKEGRQMKNLANAPSFDDIDTDNDGSVSPDEFAAHKSEHKAKRSQR